MNIECQSAFFFLRIDIGDSKHQNIRMNANAFSVGEKYWTKANTHDMAYTLRNILILCIISSLNVVIKRFQSSYYFLALNWIENWVILKMKKKFRKFDGKICAVCRVNVWMEYMKKHQDQ